MDTPDPRSSFFASGTRACVWCKNSRGRLLRLVGLSQTPIGFPPREVQRFTLARKRHRKITKSWRFTAFYGTSRSGRRETVRPQELLGLAAGLWFAFGGSLRAGWLTWTPAAAARARLTRVTRQVTREWWVPLSTTRWHAAIRRGRRAG